MASAKYKPQRELFPGVLELMILQTLQRNQMHGYALVQCLKERSAELLQIEEGSLYPVLQKMLREGSVEAEWQISPAKRRVRTYRITVAGKKRLKMEMQSYRQMLQGISLVLTPQKG